MAILFPRELPDYRLERGSFRLVDAVTSTASHAGAKINLSRISDPTWILEVQTRPMWDDDRRAWTAWMSSLRGGLREFVAYDKTRNPPLAYPGAKASTDIAGGWNGTASVSSLGASGALGLSGLPAGYQSSEGDRIGLEQDGHYGYYEVLEDAAADGSGAVTLTVAPFLHTSIFTTAATARLWLPKAKFILDWQSWQEETIGGPSPISFTAHQRVMA